MTITVSDVNDNPPVLSDDEYTLMLSESTPVFSPVNLLISYTDADSGNNGRVTYSLDDTSKRNTSLSVYFYVIGFYYSLFYNVMLFYYFISNVSYNILRYIYYSSYYWCTHTCLFP